MVVVGGLAGHEGMAARRQVHALDEAEVGQDVERAEQGRPGDPEPSPARLHEQVLGGEMRTPARDEPGERTAGTGQPVAGTIQRGDDGPGIKHARMLGQIETQSQYVWVRGAGASRQPSRIQLGETIRKPMW